jgi:hypothetical protein
LNSLTVTCLFCQYQAKAQATKKLGIHALSTLAFEPTPVFLKKKGFEIPGALASAYTGSGYGFVEDIPYAYIHEFLRSSMLGKICRVRGGYAGLWSKVASTLPDVRCNVRVQSIDRSSKDVVKIAVVQGLHPSQVSVLEFDKVIFSGSLPFPNSNQTYRSAPPVHGLYLKGLSFNKPRTFKQVPALLKESELNWHNSNL